jgi:hypothetical protein
LVTSHAAPPQSTNTPSGSPDVVLEVVAAASGPLVVVVAASGPVVVEVDGPLEVVPPIPVVVLVVAGPAPDPLVVDVVSPEDVGAEVAPPSELAPPSLPPPNTPSQSGVQPREPIATTTEANRPTLRMRSSVARSTAHGVGFPTPMSSRFSSGQSSWVEAARSFAEALFSTERGAPPRERLDRLMADLEDFISQAGPRSELVLRLGLGMAMWAAPPLVGRRPPMTRLPVVERARALEALEHSPVGLPLLAAKAILSILYYEDPEVLREAGIVGPDESELRCAREERP